MAPGTTAYVINVPVRDREGVKVGDTLSDTGHLKARTVVVRRLGSVSR
jgi:hypothetical protein